MMRGLFGSIADTIEAKAQTLDQLPGFMFGPESKTGVTVTYSTALQVMAMLACCKVVGEGVAQSPRKLMRSRKNSPGADKAADHPLYRLLSRKPNGWQTAFEFWETIVFHVMLVGNAFIFVNRVGGRVHELIIIEPNKVTVTQLPNKELRYKVVADDGSARIMPPGVIWHVRGPSWNGWMGMETVRLAREALGLALATEDAHARLHKDGAVQNGVYSVEGPLTAEQQAQLTEWIKRKTMGDRKGDPLILDRGAKWLAQQLTGVDAQHLETRRFQIEEVCRAARVLPIMAMQSDKAATYASSEQMFLAHVIHTLDPWTTRLAQSADVGLLTDAELDEGLYLEFNLSALMRGDYKSRQEGLQIQRRNGIVNANQWRDLEGWNPRDDEGGDQYIVEGNMAIQDGRDLVPVQPTKPGT